MKWKYQDDLCGCGHVKQMEHVFRMQLIWTRARTMESNNRKAES